MSDTWKIECTDGKKDPIQLSVGKTVIGRGHLLQIRELKVSRHHAEVQITDNGEFILKAMHPGLPCFYKKKGTKTQLELLRGATIQLESGDIFSLHSNPDCEFKVMRSGEGDAVTADSGDDDKPTSTVKDVEATSDHDKSNEELDLSDAEEEEEESSDGSEGSDWNGGKPRAKTGRSAKKNKQLQHARMSARMSVVSRKPPAKKKRRAVSSEEEISEEESDSDYGSRRSRRQPARIQHKLPPRRATKTISYNEDLMLGEVSASESEQESDGGLPKIGRQKKADSDSDFEIDEESASDWEEGESKRGSRRGGPPSKPSRRGRRRNSDSSEEEPEYVPRATKRRSAAKERVKSYRKNKDRPGDDDWSDPSQSSHGDEDEGSE